MHSKTLEKLEGDIWPAPERGDSYLISTCSLLRKKPLKDFTIEDLRIMIGQNMGLQYLLPMALDVLSKNVLAKGDFFAGDLLKSVTEVHADFWKQNKELHKRLKKMVEENKDELAGRCNWFSEFK